MPDLGKATYELVFDTRQGEVAIAEMEARTDAATKSIASSMGMAEKSVASVGETTQVAAGEVTAGTGEMSAGFAEAGAGAEALAAKSVAAAATTTSAWHRAGETMTKIGKRMRSVGREMTHKITLPVALIGGLAAKQAIDYAEQIKMLQTQAGATAKETRFMNEELLVLAKSGKVTHAPEELAKAMYHLESSGIRGAKAIKALTAADQLATVGHANLEESTDALAHTFKVGIRGAETFQKTVATVNATVGAGNMRLSDFNSAMSTGIVDAGKKAGLSFQEIGAALATFTIRGLPAVQSMTALRMALAQLGNPTSKQTGALKVLGFEQLELAKRMRTKGLIPTIALLRERYEKMVAAFGKEKANQVFAQAFGGAKSGKALLGLVNGSKQLEGAFNQINEKTADFKHLVAEAMGEPINKMRVNMAKMMASLIKIGDKIVPILERIVNAVSRAFEWFDKLNPKWQKFILIGLGVAAALGPILSIIGGLVVVLPELAAAAAFLFGWPGLILAAGVALGVLYVKSAAVRKAINGIWESAKPVFENLKILALTFFGLVRKHWHEIMMIVRPVLNFWMNYAKLVFGTIARLFAILTNILRGQWGAAWHGIVGLAKWGVAMIGRVAWGIVLVFQGIGKAIWSMMRGWMSAVVNVVVDALNFLIEKVNSVVSKVPTGIKREGMHIKITHSEEAIGKVGHVDWGGGKGSGKREIHDRPGPYTPKKKEPHDRPQMGKVKIPKMPKVPSGGGMPKDNWTPGALPPSLGGPKTGGGGQLGGAWTGLQNKYLEAKRTKGLADDRKALQAQERYLTRIVNQHGVSAKKKHAALQALQTVDNALAAMGRKTRGDRAKSDLFNDRIDIIEAKIAASKTEKQKERLRKQEMKMLNAQENHLKQLLKQKGLSVKRQAELSRQISAIERKKIALAKKQVQKSNDAGKEYMAVLNTRGTFFAEFAGNIFGQSSAGLTIGGTHGDKNVNVTQTNHYNEIPKNRFAAARSMQRAAAEAAGGI